MLSALAMSISSRLRKQITFSGPKITGWIRVKHDNGSSMYFNEYVSVRVIHEYDQYYIVI